MPTDIKSQIEEMIDTITPAKVPSEQEAFEEVEKPQEETKTEAETEPSTPQETKPEEPVKEERTEVREEPKREPIVEDTQAQPEPTKPTEPQEDPRIAAMQDTINRLSQMLLSAGVPQEPLSPAAPPLSSLPPSSPQAQAPQAPLQQPQAQLSSSLPSLEPAKMSIIPEGVEFEDIVNDKSTFENFMRDLLTRYETARVRRDSLATPMMVANQVRSILSLNEAVRNFYDVNKDLVNVKPLVGTLANRIVAEHPDWSLPQVMEESARQARNAIGAMLNRPQAQQQVQPPTQPKPSFATTSTSRQGQQGQKLSKMQSQIAELIDGI